MTEKPLLIAREEMAEEIAQAIDRSKLPLIVVEPVLERFLSETRALIRQEYEKEKAAYEKAVEGEEGSEK